MPTFHFSPAAPHCAPAVAATAASFGLLGGTAALFASAGSTPAFMPGSKLAQQAEQCPYPLSHPARHGCLRDIAASAARGHERDVVLDRPVLPPSRTEGRNPASGSVMRVFLRKMLTITATKTVRLTAAMAPKARAPSSCMVVSKSEA